MIGFRGFGEGQQIQRTAPEDEVTKSTKVRKFAGKPQWSKDDDTILLSMVEKLGKSNETWDKVHTIA